MKLSRLAAFVRLRQLVGLALLLGFALVATGFQLGDYPFQQKPRTRDRAKVQKERLAYEGMSDTEIKKIMKEMAAQIGVDCSYCHNEKNYKSFEKPVKEFVQYKIAMVDWLNAKYRPADADWNYSCYTCHRGVVKPLPQADPTTPLTPGGIPAAREKRGQ